MQEMMQVVLLFVACFGTSIAGQNLSAINSADWTEPYLNVSSLKPDGHTNLSTSNTTQISMDTLMTLTFPNPGACEEKLLGEWNLNLSNLQFYCVCYKICVDRTLSGRDLELQRQGVIEMMGDYHDSFPVAVRTMVAVYSCILIAGITGNLLVLVTVARFLQQATVTNVFICSLSAADLLVLAINIPTKIWQLWVGYWYLGKATCHLTHFLLYMTFLASILTLTAMSIERYLAICCPFKAQYMSTPGRARKIVAAIWLFSLLLGLPTLFVTNYYENTWVCNMVIAPDVRSRVFAVYMAVVLFLIPSTIMGVTYTKMSVTLWKSLKTSASVLSNISSEGSSHNAPGRSEHKRRIQVIRMLIMVWVVFMICWAPTMASLLCEAFGISILNRPIADHALLMRVFTCLAYSNSCLNPLLYAFFSVQFRRGFVSCFNSCTKRKYANLQYKATRSTHLDRTRMTNLHHSYSANTFHHKQEYAQAQC